MSRAGAMLDHVNTRVKLVRPKTSFKRKKRVVSQLDDTELPILMFLGDLYTPTLIKYHQREEADVFQFLYVEKFKDTDDAERLILATREAIVESIWDANVLDTAGAGYSGWVSSAEVVFSTESADRWAIQIEVTFDTTDAVDSAFSLTEVQI